MKDGLPMHLTRARWLADTLPPARIVCAATPAALDVLLYRQPATIETVADPARRILALFDALRDDPIRVVQYVAANDQGYVRGYVPGDDPFGPHAAAAAWIVARAQPDPSTVRRGLRASLASVSALVPGATRTQRLAGRLLAMQFDTDSPADMILRYDTPDALLIVLDPPARERRAIAAAVRASTGQVAIATTLHSTRPWPDLAYSRVDRDAHTRLFTTFPP